MSLNRSSGFVTQCLLASLNLFKQLVRLRSIFVCIVDKKNEGMGAITRPALVTTKDAGDAVTLLQSLAGSTFDSSQLVLKACMGYHNVDETRLQYLRNKHRTIVKAVLEERSKGVQIWKDSHGLASKLYSFKQDPGSIMAGAGKPGKTDVQTNVGESCLDASSDNVNGLYMSLNGNREADPVKDI